MLTPSQEAARLALYRTGVSDGDIGKAEGVSASAVGKWRRHHGLPTNKPVIRMAEGQHEWRLRLHREGLNDSEISRIVGVHPTRVSEWRRKQGLTQNIAHRSSTETSSPILRYPVAARIRRAIGWGLAPDIAEEVMGDMLLAITEGRLSPERIEAEARKYKSKAVSLFANGYGPRSIDEDLNEDGRKLIDLIADESASSWLEEMGASAW